VVDCGGRLSTVRTLFFVSSENTLSRVSRVSLGTELPVYVLDKSDNLGERKRADVSALFRFFDNDNLTTEHSNGVLDIYDLVRFVARV
jgi:hypothetical protein